MILNEILMEQQTLSVLELGVCNQQILNNYLCHNVARSSNLLHFQ